MHTFCSCFAKFVKNFDKTMSISSEKDNNLFDIDFQYINIATLAMQQYGLDVAKSLTIANITEKDFTDLTVELCSDMDFVSAFKFTLALIRANESVDISPNLKISAAYLLQLSERIEANLILKICSSDGQIVFENHYPISVFPADFWTGIDFYPELTAAYVTPNIQGIKSITARAAHILQEWTQDGSFDGYMSRNVNRVRKMAAAIYESIKELGLVYSLSPKSFETAGQRVRLVDELLSNKIGNCLDLTLLFAACLENANLNPLVIIVSGHAFVGLHLCPETFVNCASDDSTEITKRIATGMASVCVFETTMVTNSSTADFDTACHSAETTLAKTDSFKMVIDIERCRYSDVKPLPLKTLQEGGYVIEQSEPVLKQEHDKPQEISIYDIPTLTPNDEQITKQNIWERKLLDLSLRNSLLNLRFTRKTLLLMSNGINKIEDILSDGKDFRILPRPSEMHGNDDDFINTNVTIPANTPLASFIFHEIESKRLHSFLSETANAAALKFIYRNSKTSLEENGANTLYLALGLLRWYETERSETPRYAPILLLPIEIVRRSATTGYVIRSRDEDVIANITLSEMLRQNYGLNLGLPDPLPLDESGVDVTKILAVVRHAVMTMPRWDVEEKAVIGNFSFNKFVMWNDIHNNHESLKANKIVSSLIEGQLQFNQVADNITAQELDKTESPSQLILPVSADSSQLEAIHTAISGQSFILFGPPGTGKSQTITNIIANALYKGQRVLFVAQKAAALNVVTERLDKLGLSPFCLNVFSNKTSKSYVLEQLKAAVEQTKYKEPEEFAVKAEKLFELRGQLGSMMQSLHKKYPNGISVYDAISTYVSMDANISEDVFFPLGMVSGISQQLADTWFEIVDEITSVCKFCGNPINNKLNSLYIKEYRQDLRLEIEQNIKQSLDMLPNFQLQAAEVATLLGAKNVNSLDDLKLLKNLANEVGGIKNMSQKVAAFVDQNDKKEQYFNALIDGKHSAYTRAALRQKYSESVLTQDWQPDLAKWKSSENQWFLPRFFTKRAIRKKLSAFSTSSKSIEPEQDMVQILDYKSLCSKSLKYAELNEIFSHCASETSDDWDEKLQMLKKLYSVDENIRAIAKNPQEFSVMKSAFVKLFANGYKSFKDYYVDKFVKFSHTFDSYMQLSEKLQSIAGLELDAVKQDYSNESFVEKRFALMKQILDGLDGLKDWIMYLTVKKKAEENLMSFATNFFETTKITPLNWPFIFKKSYCRAFLDSVFATDENLNLFKGEIFNEKILKYRELNSRYTQLAKAELVALLSSRMPDFNIEASQNSEAGILLRNIRNNGRGTSIRNIFDQIPNLLARLCPCMLMSPMSVSQFLDLEKQQKFDITIFDEASQMPTSEAVGAIARSKNVVITGDPKQMPPTSFFAASQTDEDNVEIEDLESILDDALALSIKSKHLLWHYRSKHESLIAFSNSEYYDNKLLTFPSPDNRISKVSFVKVNGFYDKGKTRRNQAEAKAVIDEIRRRLSDSQLCKQSIGVVTFNIVQQQLIDDMLNDLFATYPDMEKIAMSGNEPIFVKNLENVQGDERDVILFSVGYGPDASGRVSMNFGPLNQKGGERRLNVAVSRARYEMMVFSSLTADMIDLNRTMSKGVEGLKKFLAFAQRGVSAIKNATIDKNEKNVVAEQIAEKLRLHGYNADTCVGCSGFRIDVAVCDPNDPERYILAIVCDNDNPSKSKTVRDREIIQPDILNALGWNTLKVWSVDWFNDSNKVISNILDKISTVNQQPTQNTQSVDVQEDIKLEESNSSLLQQSNYVCQPVEYQSAELKEVSSDIEYVQGLYLDYLDSQLSTLLNIEAPITMDYAIKRIATAWRLSRITPHFANEIKNIVLKRCVPTTSFNDKTTLWSDSVTPANYTSFRINSNREALQIPCLEMANAIKYLVANQIAVPMDELKRSVSKIMGFSRWTSSLDIITTDAINYLMHNNEIVEKDDKIILA